MRKICFNTGWATSLALAILLTAPAAFSLPLLPSEIPANWSFSIPVTPSTAGFQPQSHTYFSTATGTGGIHASPSQPVSPLATDIESTTLLSAKVSPTGQLESGTFALIGSSESLGIATGTTLLSATITDVHWDPSDDASLFQFRARVDFVSPALGAATGPVKSLLIYDFVHMSENFVNNPWNGSFLGTGPTTSPTVWMSHSALPLTHAEIINLSFETSGFDTTVTTYDHITNLLTSSATIGDTGDPATILSVSAFPPTVVADDAIGTLGLTATIDENGIVHSGSMDWTGKIPSLGIPVAKPLIEGTVTDAHVFSQDDIPRFEYLVMVDHIHPFLEAAVGPVETLLIYDYHSPSLDFFENPWSISYSGLSYTHGPDIAGSPESMMNSDSDGDGIADRIDNCTTTSNVDQRDTNGDGYGNYCDPDLNDDGIVNFADVVLWVTYFNTATEGDADFNGDGIASFGDYALYPQYFLRPPGPSQVSPSEPRNRDAYEIGK